MCLLRSYNSAGLECNPYKVEVVGSNPTGTTNVQTKDNINFIKND